MAARRALWPGRLERVERMIGMTAGKGNDVTLADMLDEVADAAVRSTITSWFSAIFGEVPVIEVGCCKTHILRRLHGWMTLDRQPSLEDLEIFQQKNRCWN